jgi:LytS/YehU family sensor histidine kinase
MAGIDPHFLINVVSSMAALARRKSEHLEESLLHLSDLLLYITYQSQAECVTLKQEADHLRNYIELQKLRFSGSVRIDLSLRMDGETADQLIEPLLLMPFVEHAFNCGATSLADPAVHVRIEAAGGKLSFTVENSYDPDPFNAIDGDWSIRLENLRAHLNLKYPRKYSLTSGKKGNVFQVKFELTLP